MSENSKGGWKTGKRLSSDHKKSIGTGVKNSLKHKESQKNKKCHGEDNPNWRPKIEYHCPVCDKVIMLTQAKFNEYTNGRRSCSRKCGYDRKLLEGKTNKGIPNPEHSKRMRENNPMKNSEVAAKMGSTTREKWENGEMEHLRIIFKENGIKRKGHCYLTDEGRKNISINMTKNNPMKNPETVAKVSKKLIENYADGIMAPPNPINGTRYNTGYFIDSKGRKLFYASGWELSRMEFLDSFGDILFWDKIKSSFRIPYKDKNGKKRTYFPDFYVVYNGQRVVEEVGDWMEGKEEKIKAAFEYFSIRNIKFVVLTRGTLNEETWI